MLKGLRNYTTIPDNKNQFKMFIHETKHLIGSRQRLLETVARKLALVARGLNRFNWDIGILLLNDVHCAALPPQNDNKMQNH